MVRHWARGDSVTEDALDSVPQTDIIHNILAIMWGEEAISRIASTLGNPKEERGRAPPPLEVCVSINKNFTYPDRLHLRVEGQENSPDRDVTVNVEYERKVPYCIKCVGFGHWPQKCRVNNDEPTGVWRRHVSGELAQAIGIPYNREPHQNENQMLNSNSNQRVRRSRARPRRNRATRKEYSQLDGRHGSTERQIAS